MFDTAVMFELNEGVSTPTSCCNSLRTTATPLSMTSNCKLLRFKLVCVRWGLCWILLRLSYRYQKQIQIQLWNAVCMCLRVFAWSAAAAAAAAGRAQQLTMSVTLYALGLRVRDSRVVGARTSCENTTGAMRVPVCVLVCLCLWKTQNTIKVIISQCQRASSKSKVIIT